MKITQHLLLLVAAIQLSGCCYHNMKGYEWVNGSHQFSNPNDILNPYITIDSTPKTKRIPFLFAWHANTYPYSIYLYGYKKYPSRYSFDRLQIHSIKLSADDQIIFETTDPVILKEKWRGKYEYRHNLAENLPWIRGQTIHLELVWEIPATLEKQTHSADYKAIWGPPLIHPLFLFRGE